MRFALVPVALALTGCLGVPAEPLGESQARFDDRTDTIVERGDAAVLPRFAEAGGTFNVAAPAEAPPQDEAPPETQPTEQEQRRQAVLAEIALTIGFAADVSYNSAEAGLARDVATARQAALDAIAAAQTIEQRAFEAMNIAVAGDDGCAGGEIGEQPTEDPVLDEAIVTAFNAASATSEIANELSPEDVTVCGEGCGATCETVPGEIDQVALDFAIENAVAAGDDCAAIEEVIAFGD